MIVMDTDGTPLDELVRSWDGIREDYQVSEDSRNDRTVLDCAALLAADPVGELAYLWTFGLVLTAPYLTWLPGEGVVTAAVDALRAADKAMRARHCDHASHPYETHTDEDDEHLAALLPPLADETDEWQEDRPRDEWLCPRNAAGFARIAMDIIEPGSATDIPARLPLEALDAISTLSALLEGYAKPWTDIDDEIASQGWNLSTAADPDERAGRVMVVRAVSWYAVSGMVRKKSVLDDLIEALEKTLTHDSGPCPHGPDGHPQLPDSGPSAAELGIRLSSAGGRGAYERDRRIGSDAAPLETLLCPAFTTATARESLDLLCERREVLFGRRDTSHADAEYLRPDGRLDIEKITERLDELPWNEEYAEDLGLWAARRYEHTSGDRERAVLLLTAYQAMHVAYPSPALPVVRDILPVLRTVAGFPRPQECGHSDEHPRLRYAEFRQGMPHFYAPDEFPAPEGVSGPEAWTCARFLGEVADKGVDDLEDLIEDEEDDDEE